MPYWIYTILSAVLLFQNCSENMPQPLGAASTSAAVCSGEEQAKREYYAYVGSLQITCSQMAGDYTACVESYLANDFALTPCGQYIAAGGVPEILLPPPSGI